MGTAGWQPLTSQIPWAQCHPGLWLGQPGIPGRNKIKPPPEWEEGVREEILKEISFPKREYVTSQMAAGGKLQMGLGRTQPWALGVPVSLWKWCPSGRTQGTWLLPFIQFFFKLPSQNLNLIPVKTGVTQTSWLTGNSLGTEPLKFLEVLFGLDC